MSQTWKVIQGAAPRAFEEVDTHSVHCVVTSPPYWGLRSYGDDTVVEWPEVRYSPLSSLPAILIPPWRGQLGLEPTPEAYVGHLVAVLRQLRRVLRQEGTLWLNLGDTYASGAGRPGNRPGGGVSGRRTRSGHGAVKPKDLVGIPWRVALALQADGWWLRAENIWHKPNAIPESAKDRPTRNHEHIFQFAKGQLYFYDHYAGLDTASGSSSRPGGRGYAKKAGLRPRGHSSCSSSPTRNRRTVWTLTTQPSGTAHYSTFPLALPQRCLIVGSSARGCCATCGSPRNRVLVRREGSGHTTWEHDRWEATCACAGATVPCVVLDPFSGTGTTGRAAIGCGRSYIGIEPSAEFARIQRQKLGEMSLLAHPLEPFPRAFDPGPLFASEDSE